MEYGSSGRPFFRTAAACIAALTLALVMVPRVVRAQLSTGSIAGTIVDESGAVLPGVTVTAKNLGTAQERVVTSSDTGRFQLAGLAPGPYSVTAELAGFASIVRSQVAVPVGSVVDVNLSMSLATVQETVTVTTEAPLIQSAETSLSNVVTQAALEALPSKNRQYLDFALLLPTSVESVTQIQGTGAVVGGARSREGTLLVDGFYNLDEGFAMPKQRHSQDTIQEFQLVTFGGAAEYGRAIGGVINAVTKSGTNRLAGTGYGFFRTTALNAQAVEERLRGSEKSDYDRQQWGGSIGGPLKSNRTFFFASAERLNENWPYDNGITASDAAAIGLPAEDVGTIPRYLKVGFVFGKIDHNISPTQHFQASYSYTNANDFQYSSPSTRATRSYIQRLPFIDWAYVANWNKIANEGKLLHDVKFSYFPRDYHSGGISEGGAPLVANGQINIGDADYTTPPRVQISSVANFGSATLNNWIKTYPVQVLYTSSLFKDAHTFKFGLDYMYAYYAYDQFSPRRGAYTFTSLSNYLAGVYSQYTQSFGAVSNDREHQYISAFFQDSWQASKRLTINYGIRYDAELNPVQMESGVPFGNDFNNFGPRAALSFDLTDKGTTFVKINSGLYYDRLWNNYTNNLYSLKDHVTRQQYTWTPSTPGAPAYPATFASLPDNAPAAARDVILMPAEVKVPQSFQFIATLDHAFSSTLALSVSGIYSESWFKDRQVDTNLTWTSDTGPLLRIDPDYRTINQLTFDTKADYVGGVVELTTRATRYGFTANTTISRARSVASSGTSSDPRLGWQNDFGRLPDNATWRGVLSGWYNITSSIQASANVTARTGIAVNPVATGLDVNGDGVTGDRTPGFAPFEFTAPGNHSIDARLTWMLPVQGNRKLNLYLEGFNITNQERIRTVDNNYGAVAGSPNARFMVPTAYFPPREIQLGVRLIF